MFNLKLPVFSDTPPDPCTSKDCTNADGCTVDNDDNAVCFCQTGYDLLANDTCVGE